jgi:hypothetical protein
MAGSLNGLSRVAREALWVLALNALDQETKNQPAHIYFRGWNHLAACLGYAGREATPGARSAVKRAMRELTEAGYIKAEGHLNGRASPMVYRLTL